MKKLANVDVVLLPPSARRPAARARKILDLRKLESGAASQMESPLRALESLLIFDSYCLDMDTRRELVRVLPALVRIRRAWKAEFAEYGCASCHKKKVSHGAGGFCDRCTARIYHRMQRRFRKAMEGRNLPAELDALRDALLLKYSAAQRLFGGDSE